jgi:hypothetical protein
VTTVNNQLWITIHAYVLVDWEKILLLLSLEQLTKRLTTDELTKTIMNALEKDNGLSGQDI